MEGFGELLGGLFEGIFGGAAEGATEVAADELSRKLAGDRSLDGASGISPTRYLVGGPRVLGINDI